MDRLNTLFQKVAEAPPAILAAAAVLLVLIGVGIILAFRRKSPHLTAYSGASGTVLVSKKALQELIKQTCLRDEFVESAKPLIKLSGERIDVRVKLRLASPDHLRPTCERLQDRVAQLLQKSLSFEELGEIQIFVSSFGKTDSESAKAQTSELTPSKSKNPAPSDENTKSEG